MNAITRPALRWHGGKWLLAPWIISHFPQHRVYVEPFGGAASVLLRKPRSYAEIYNDLDSGAVNFFRVMRDNGQALIERLRLTPFSRAEFIGAYEACDDPIETARRFALRCWMGHGTAAANNKTGFRANMDGRAQSVAVDWKNWTAKAHVLADRLQGVVIESLRAQEVIERQDRTDALFYVDPPYMPETIDPGKDYGHELSPADHEGLLSTLRDLQGAVVVSGYRCELYDDMLADWTRIDRRSLADGARERVESLWLSFDENQGRLFD